MSERKKYFKPKKLLQEVPRPEGISSSDYGHALSLLQFAGLSIKMMELKMAEKSEILPLVVDLRKRIQTNIVEGVLPESAHAVLAILTGKDAQVDQPNEELYYNPGEQFGGWRE